MATVEEYVRMAEEAQEEGAHVAVLTYYRTAIETAVYNPNAADILLTAVRYAHGLKKEKDKVAIADWSKETLGKIQAPNLAELINEEIAKLQTKGKENAAT